MHHRTILDGGAYGGHGVASTFYTGILQPTTYTLTALQFEAVRFSRTRRPAVRSAAMGLLSRVRPRKSKWTRSPTTWDRPGRDAQTTPDSAQFDNGELDSRRHLALGQCIDKVVAGSGWEGQVPEAALRKGNRDRLQRLHDRDADSHLLQQDAALRRPIETGPQRPRNRLLRSAEIGQGSDSILAYIVAEVLGIDPFDIRVVTGDTDLTPVDLGSYSSRVTLMTGNAAIEAAERASTCCSRPFRKTRGSG